MGVKTNAATQRVRKARNTSGLIPFKPGKSGNPRGSSKLVRSRAILSKKERLQLLSQYAKMNPKKANPIEAIREHNRMEGVYLEAQPGYQDNRQYNIIVRSEKTREDVERLLRGEKPQDIVGEDENNR